MPAASRAQAIEDFETIEAWRRNPVAFVRDVLGDEPWAGGCQILEAVAVPHSRVAVRGSHGVGKSHSAAELVIWGLATGFKVVVTASRFEQVKRNIFAKVHDILGRSRIPIGVDTNLTEIQMLPDTYAVGWSTNEETRFHGEHGRLLLFIVDEASGVDDGIMRAIDGARAGGDVRELLLANPSSPSGGFHEASNSAAFHSIRLDSFDTPSMRHVRCTKAGVTGPGRVRELEDIPEDELDAGPAPYLAGPRYVKEMLVKYGPESNIWRWKVRGDFPQQDVDALILKDWIDAQIDRELPLEKAEREHAEWMASPIYDIENDEYVESEPLPITVGIDVAGPGEDEHVIAAFEGDREMFIDGQSGTELAELRNEVDAQEALVNHTLGVLNQLPRPPKSVRVDEIGVGAYLIPILRAKGFNAVGINVAHRCLRDEDRAKYANEKARLFWGLRERFRLGNIAGVTDERTREQLGWIRWAEPAGRIQIESKDKIRERRLPSPDRAEAVMLALGELVEEGGALAVLA